MQQELRDFAETIMNLQPSNLDNFGGGLPGFGRGGAGTIGGTTSNAEMLVQLKRKTAEFVRLRAKKPPNAGQALSELAQAIEGLLLAQVTIGACNEKRMAKLIDQLKKLTEG